MKQLLRGARVVDGTGAPARDADVLVDGDRISTVGSLSRSEIDDATVIDLDGLTLAPGFVDPHTHLDAQILWDPDLSPSSWHGVTSVVMGNCGFTIAPNSPSSREQIILTLEQVEGMSAASLRAGIDWRFESFSEYLAVLSATPKRLNVGAMIGHTAVRLAAMGPSATERAATADEIQVMKGMVKDAVTAGALGFSSSKSEFHIGAWGQPVPSRLAEADELTEISLALTELNRGVIEVVPGTAPGTYGPLELAELSKRTGRAVTWPGILTGIWGAPGAAVDLLEKVSAYGGNILPQTTCRPLGGQITLASEFNRLVLLSESFRQAIYMSNPERIDLYSSAEWRKAAVEGVSAKALQRLRTISIDESPTRPDLVGQTIGEIADRSGEIPLLTLLDIGIADKLETRFHEYSANTDEVELAMILNDRRCMVGLSDAGAHMDHLCDAIYATHLLGYWTREKGVLSLEDAIWKLTDQPARFFGLTGRGRIRPGYYSDLVAFDASTVGAGPLRRVTDLPGGSARLVADSYGVEHVWVNGVRVRENGVDLPDVRPGVLLAGIEDRASA